PPQLRGEQVVLLRAALAQGSRVVREQLLLRQQGRVQLLADRVLARRLVLLLLEELAERLEGVAGHRTGGGQLLAGGGVLDLLRDELARVLRRGAGLPDRGLAADARPDAQVPVLE